MTQGIFLISPKSSLDKIRVEIPFQQVLRHKMLENDFIGRTSVLQHRNCEITHVVGKLTTWLHTISKIISIDPHWFDAADHGATKTENNEKDISYKNSSYLPGKTKITHHPEEKLSTIM